MLIGIFGNIGTGKTLLLVFFLKYLSHKHKYANFTTKIENVKPITLEQLLEYDFPNEKTLIAIDEAYVVLDSRLAMKKQNVILTHLIFQSRKRKIDIIYASQLKTSVDVRLRNLTNINILALGKDDDGFHYYVQEYDEEFIIPWDLANELFKLYDTYELIRAK
jgi:hypothetical protein